MKSIKEMIAVMQGCDDGRAIQFRARGSEGSWIDTHKPMFDWFSKDYRVKPAEPDSFDWDALDRLFNFLARDMNGQAYVFTTEPSIRDDKWWGGHMMRIDGLFYSYENNGCDWRDSLQQRPEAN